jgi:hypothetical protein
MPASIGASGPPPQPSPSLAPLTGEGVMGASEWYAFGRCMDVAERHCIAGATVVHKTAESV